MVQVKTSEHENQVAFIDWCKISKVPVYANPNGVYFPVPPFFPLKYRVALNTIIQKIISKMKKEGAFVKGLPDLTIPVATKKYGSLYIEMKIKGNYPTKEQKVYMEMLEKYGNKCIVCYSTKEAIDETKKYLQGE